MQKDESMFCAPNNVFTILREHEIRVGGGGGCYHSSDIIMRPKKL